MRRSGLLVAALGVLALGACQRAGTSADEIVLLTEAPIARLDPRYAVGAWETRVSRLIAPGLTGLAERGLAPTPGLAASVTAENERTYVATLRPDARFSDGTPVTAADVKYTFDSTQDPLLGSPWAKGIAEILESTEVVDDRTVRFRLDAPRASFRNDLDFGIISRRAALPLDEAVREAARAKRRPPSSGKGAEVVGAGPYQLASHEPDAVILARNPHSHTKAATLRFVVRTIRDDNSRVLALMGGSGDAVQNIITPLVLETLENDPKLQVVYGPSATVSYVGFNLEDKVLRDRRVRQAIAQGIDRERIVSAKLRGHAEIASSFLDRQNPFFTDLPAWKFDPAAARKLLDEAGYPDPDGAGPRPRFSLTWKTSANRFRIALAQLMARQLADIGIQVDVRSFEFATFIDDIRKGNVQLFSLQLTDVVEPDMLRAVFHSSRIPPDIPSGLNRFRYRNAETDRWLEAANATSDVEKRKALYADVQKVLHRDLPAFPLFHEHDVIASSRRLTNLRHVKTGRLEAFLPVVKAPAEQGAP